MSDNLTFIFPKRSSKGESVVLSLPSLLEGQNVIAFIENEQVDVILDSDEYQVTLECPACSLSNNSAHYCRDNQLILEKGKKYRISDGGDEILGFIPDRYRIDISQSGNHKCVFFQVKYNSQLNEEGMSNISSKLEEILHGLSLDILSPKTDKGFSSFSEKNDLSPFLTIEEKKTEFYQKCLYLRTHLKEDTLPVYRKESHEGKQDLKSIRMNLTHAHSNNTSYNLKKIPSYDIPENQILKYYLMRISGTFFSLHHFLNGILNECKARYCQLSENENEVNQRQKELKNTESRIATQKRANLSYNYHEKRAHLANLKNKFSSWLTTLSKCERNLRQVLDSSLMNEISIPRRIILSRAFLINRNFSFFKDYEERISSFKNERGKESHSFSRKRSFALFELYGFSIIKDVLEDLGYQETGSNVTSLFDFMEDAQFNYEKEDFQVKVVYNHFCQSYETENNNAVVNINSSSNKPDYLLEFKRKGEDDAFSLLVIEMKYRKGNKLFQGGKVLEAQSTLMDYFQLGYKNSQGRILRGLVKEAVILFPSKEEEGLDEQNFGFEMIGINVQKKEMDSKGFERLKEIMQDTEKEAELLPIS